MQVELISEQETKAEEVLVVEEKAPSTENEVSKDEEVPSTPLSVQQQQEEQTVIVPEMQQQSSQVDEEEPVPKEETTQPILDDLDSESEDEDEEEEEGEEKEGEETEQKPKRTKVDEEDGKRKRSVTKLSGLYKDDELDPVKLFEVNIKLGFIKGIAINQDVYKLYNSNESDQIKDKAYVVDFEIKDEEREVKYTKLEGFGSEECFKLITTIMDLAKTTKAKTNIFMLDDYEIADGKKVEFQVELKRGYFNVSLNNTD